MKKIFLILFAVFVLCGCGKISSEDVVKDFSKKINSSKSYKITGTMEISNDEETFNYSLETYYLKSEFYKVILVNQTNNHEQVILKNKEDIYVITPSLNKSFKFQSEWPNNSSQAYLLDSLVKDITGDDEYKIEKIENGYIINCEVNYPNNEELKYEKIYLDDDMNVSKVEVYDENDIVKIKVMFDSIDLKAGLSEEDFSLSTYIKEDTSKIDEESKDKNNNNSVENEETDNNENKSNVGDSATSNNNECTGDDCNTQENETKETSTLEEIIYPLYIPSNTYLSSAETLDFENSKRVILTFSGEKNFVLIEETSVVEDEMSIIPVYGEPLMLTEVIGAKSASSLSWDINNISYYLASNDLSVGEMSSIANSLGNASLVSSLK